MLYDLILQAPHPSTNPSTTPFIESHADDSVVGSITQEFASKPSSQSNPKATPTTTAQNNTPPPTTPGKTSDICVVQSTTTDKSQQPRSKKKGKGKAKKNSPQQEKPKTQPVEDTQKHKPKYPCLICKEEHYTKDCSLSC
jgi:hypothetical protein